MPKLILHVANANGELTDKFVDYAKQAIHMVETKKVLDILKIDHSIDIFLFGWSTNEFTRKSVTGYAPDKYQIYLNIGTLGKDSNPEYIFWVLCHELCHVRRYDGQGCGKTLFDAIIFEGLADNFAFQMTGTKPLYDKYKDTKKLLTTAEKYYDTNDYNYQNWFHNGIKDLQIPKLAGYQIGWHIVQDYLEKHHLKASDVVLRQSRFFGLTRVNKNR